MTRLEEEIATAIAWLREQACRVPFGEIGVRLVMHDGRLSRIEKTVTEKQQPDGRDATEPGELRE